MSGRPRIARILAIGGSDSGGGAGIQADLRAITALGGHAMTAVTAITVQNTLGVFDVMPVPAATVAAQMRAVLEDIGADAVKTGMLHDAAIVSAVADMLCEYPDLPLVLDPVMISTSGRELLDAEGVAAMRKRLIPRATLLTPNLPEAAALTGRPVTVPDDMRASAEALRAAGAANVLVKGGHLGGDRVVDILATAHGITEFAGSRLPTRHTHGTGCTLASAIATLLARGETIDAAVERAREYLRTAIVAAPGLGQGNGPLGNPRMSD